MVLLSRGRVYQIDAIHVPRFDGSTVPILPSKSFFLHSNETM